MVLIEQYEMDFSQLRITSEEHGIGYRGKPMLIGSPEAIAFLERDDVDFAECKTGFGSYSMRKRERMGDKRYWHAYCRKNGELLEAYIGLAENITANGLDEIAIKLSA